MQRAALLAVLAASACASVSPAGLPVTGEWGGPHIGLSLDASSGRIEYDCAGGTIEAIIPGSSGRFAASGTHTPKAGGPVYEGQMFPTYSVAFTGAVRGDRMTLHGRVENGVELGPFTLSRGAEPGVFRCL